MFNIKLNSYSLILLIAFPSLLSPYNNLTTISQENHNITMASNLSLLNWKSAPFNVYGKILSNSEIGNEYSFSPSRIEMFSFIDVTVEVRDAYGRPVSGAWVKAFSEDWGVTYPHFDEWGLTNSSGIYNFRLPKGKWTFIGSTGWSQSNEGIFVAITKNVDNNDYLVLRPKERLNIAFIDENGVYIQPDEVYVFLTRLIPALPPALVSYHHQGTFSLYIGGNLTDGLMILGIKRSTTSINYLLLGKTSLNETTVTISAKNSAEITFEAYNPDKSSSTYWNVEFRLPELHFGNWVYYFQIYGKTVVKITPMKIILHPRFIPPDWYYYFENIYLELEENCKYLYRLGGQFSFRLWVIKEDTQLWFDIRDEFGNVLAFYSGPNNSRYIMLKIYENNVVTYDKNIGPDIPGTLFYSVRNTFLDNATYTLEIDTGPILGLIRKTGFLYSEEHTVRYINFTADGFNFDVPEEYFWTIANQSRIDVFVDSILKLYDSIGAFVEEDLKAKPFTVKVNFEWCGVGGYRFVGFGVGVARWPSMIPCYASIISHELGHMYSFTSSKPYDVEWPWFCEPLATYLGIEGIARIHGDNVRLWYWGSHPFFFDYIAGKANITSYLDEIENMQFIFFYIHKMYGPAVHKEFFKNWDQASLILREHGYSNLESVVILYSLLIKENIAWLFNFAGFNVSDDKILEGIKLLAKIKSLSWLTFILRSNADLHIYDPYGRHVGKNYETGEIEIQIPNATYTNNEIQNITIPELESGNYRIVLVGTGTGSYILNMTGGVGEIIVSEYVYIGNITKGEVQDSIVNVAMITWLTVYVEEPNPVEAMVQSSTGTGNVSFVSDAGTIGNLTAISESDLPAEGKPAFSFPHGFFSFNITGLITGQTVNVTIVFPSDIPVTAKYWKYHTPEGWYQMPIRSNDGDNIIIIQLTDGGIGDDDGVANGVIVDVGGPGIPLLPPVGGKIVSVNKIELLAPGIKVLTMLVVIAVTTVSAIIFARRRYFYLK